MLICAWNITSLFLLCFQDPELGISSYVIIVSQIYDTISCLKVWSQYNIFWESLLPFITNLRFPNVSSWTVTVLPALVFPVAKVCACCYGIISSHWDSSTTTTARQQGNTIQGIIIAPGRKWLPTNHRNHKKEHMTPRIKRRNTLARLWKRRRKCFWKTLRSRKFRRILSTNSPRANISANRKLLFCSTQDFKHLLGLLKFQISHVDNISSF